MKQFLTFVFTCLPLLCIGAPTYTSYFNNVHVYTNITLGGVTRNTWPSSGVSGTVINTGASTVGAVPRYTDLTGTNVAPSVAFSIASDGSAVSGESYSVVTPQAGPSLNAVKVDPVGITPVEIYAIASSADHADSAKGFKRSQIWPAFVYDNSFAGTTNDATYVQLDYNLDAGNKANSYWSFTGDSGGSIVLKPWRTNQDNFLFTSSSRSSGDIFKVRNFGTNLFTVAYDGATTVNGPITTLTGNLLANGATFTNGITAEDITVSGNVGTTLSVGDTTFVNLAKASQTNSVSGALTFAHATNGVHGSVLTHLRWLFNSSGSDQTLTIPSTWRTNVFSAVPPALTNGTITVMYLKAAGPTADSASQTNCYVSFEYYK